MRRIAFALSVLLLLGATSVSAQEISGTIVRIDQPARVVVLNDGRMWRLTDQSVLLVDNRPVQIVSLQPGTPVVLRSWEPVTVREGQYVVVTQAPIVTSPAPVVVAPAPVVVAPGTTQTTVTTTTTTTTPVAPLTRGSGTVSSVDFRNDVIVFTDGRLLQLMPKSVVLMNGEPLARHTLRPGLTVDVLDFNPIVYRDGRNAVLNTGYRDPGTGAWAMTWDSKFAGYEAVLPHGGMQIQGE